MNFQFYTEKLFASQEFADFKKEFPDAFLTSGFFSIDKDKEKQGQDQFHLDFYAPSIKKLFSFKLEKGVEKLPMEILEGQKFEKISDGQNFSFEELEEMIKKEMDKQDIKNTIQKFIYSLQKSNGREVLFVSVFISGFAILKVSIDLREKKIISFEKKNFMDFLKVSGSKKEGKEKN